MLSVVGVPEMALFKLQTGSMGLLMQHNDMASSGKKGSSTQLQCAEHSLI